MTLKNENDHDDVIIKKIADIGGGEFVLSACSVTIAKYLLKSELKCSQAKLEKYLIH